MTLDAPSSLERREAIRRVGAWLGVMSCVGGASLLAAAERERGAAPTPAGGPDAGSAVGAFSAGQVALLDEIAETILPATRTPGAKAAGTGAFMARMVTDAYSPVEREIFVAGLGKIDAAMRDTHHVPFLEATAAQRLALVTALDAEQKYFMDARAAVDTGRAVSERHDVPYFRMMKELAMLGFFTSEVGCTQVQRYVETPGRYDPCLPYSPGEPAWAPHA